MTRSEFKERTLELSVQFLREKRDGMIPINSSWAAWCWLRSIYPLTDEDADTQPAQIDPGELAD